MPDGICVFRSSITVKIAYDGYYTEACGIDICHADCEPRVWQRFGSEFSTSPIFDDTSPCRFRPIQNPRIGLCQSFSAD